MLGLITGPTLATCGLHIHAAYPIAKAGSGFDGVGQIGIDPVSPKETLHEFSRRQMILTVSGWTQHAQTQGASVALGGADKGGQVAAMLGTQLGQCNCLYGFKAGPGLLKSDLRS